ncbi:MAG TPA: alpha/beta family hydrolase [Candidatus Limnocylindria bacterium]|nr:alpha/beta family hydrolase [Candidatus Limnocylindria bacterium]
MRVYLAHGASGTAASMRPHVEGLERRGVKAQAVELPKRRAEAAVPVYEAAVLDWSEAVIGGHSYGGRVASLLAAQRRPLGLVLLSYPLHRPGQPEWRPRTDHWPKIDCPVLLLSGEADPFASINLLREAVGHLPQAQLVTYPRLRHGLQPVLDDVLDRVAAFVSDLGG